MISFVNVLLAHLAAAKRKPLDKAELRPFEKREDAVNYFRILLSSECKVKSLSNTLAYFIENQKNKTEQICAR